MDARVIGWLLLVALMGTPVPRLAAALERDREPATTEPAEPEEEKAWPVYLHFGWDDGIVYEAGNRVHLPMRGALRLFESDAIVSGRIGARLHLDAAVFASTGGLDVPGPRMQVRRGYFNFVGDVHTKVPLRYAVEVGFNQNRLFVDKSWLEISDVWRGIALRIGQFDAPFSLENMQSSNAIALLESAQPVNAFAPGTKAGIQIARGGGNRRVAWTFGYYADTQDVEVDNKTTSPARLLSRVTWVPSWFDDPARAQLLHLGASLEGVVSSAAKVEYAARPESKQAAVLLDTGEIDASQAVTHGLEAAFVRRDWRLQGEYLAAAVTTDPGTLYFWGTYVLASRVLTGEAYPYDRRSGSFGMVRPSTPVSPRLGHWRGAWEVAGRYSHLDLDDGRVRGGRSNAVGIGLNWYWSHHLRLMFDYGVTLTSGLPNDGSVHVFQTRLQVAY